MSLWWGLQEVCPVCVCNCVPVSVTLKSDTSSHSTAKTHPSSITVSFSIPHHVLLLMGDTVIFANICPPRISSLKIVGCSTANVAPKRYPRISFQNKNRQKPRKKNFAAHEKQNQLRRVWANQKPMLHWIHWMCWTILPTIFSSLFTRLPWRWFGQTASGVPHICLFGQRWQQVKAVIKIYNNKKTI